MKKLFRTCTALLMAMCLVLGLGAGVAASAAETEDLTKQDLVDWAKDILDEITAADITKAEVAAKLEALVEEAKDILDRIEAVDVTKAGAVEALKELSAKMKAVLVRIQNVDLREVVPAEKIVLAVGAVVVVMDKIEAIDIESVDVAAVLKKLAAEAKDALEKIDDIEFREELTAAKLEKLVKKVNEMAIEKTAKLEKFLADKEVELDEITAEAEAAIADAKEKIEEAKDARDQLEEAYELRAEADAKLADAKAELADAKAELEQKKAEIGADASRIQEIIDAEAKLADAEAKLAEKEAELNEKKAELADAEAELIDVLEDMGVEVDEDDDLLEVLDHTIADAEQQVADAEAALDAAAPVADVAFEKLYAAVKAAKKASAKLEPYANKAIEESQPVLDAMFAVYDAMKILVGEGANAAALELQSALHEMVSATIDYVENVTGKRSERLDQIASKVKAELDQMYRDATQAELDCVELSKVVALGDKNVYGAAADMVGSMTQNFMGEGNYTYINRTVAGQTAAQLRANLSKYAADLEGATVITLAFGTNAFSKYAFDKVTNSGTCDWGKYIGEDNAAYIEECKAELYEKLEAKGVKNIDTVVLMAESYAFAYLQHLLSYYPLIRDIHAMNPDAHVVMVGMHNPLEGFATEVGGVEVPLGDFMRYLADISNIYSLSYAMLSENKLYVDAFEIEVGNEGAYYEHVPTQKGHAEIAQNIWDALGVHDHHWVEDEDAKTEVKEGDKTITTTWEECTICGARRSTTNVKTGDMIGVVLVTLAVSGLGISVLKRREN